MAEGFVAFTIRLPASLHNRLKHRAVDSSISMNTAFEQAVSVWLQALENETTHPPTCPLAFESGDTVEAAREFVNAWKAATPEVRVVLGGTVNGAKSAAMMVAPKA